MKRESGFELLRIVAIVLITTHHLLINGLDLCGYNRMFEISKDSGLASFFNSLCVGGGGKYFSSNFRLVWNKTYCKRCS